jgi:hypothetical protein
MQSYDRFTEAIMTRNQNWVRQKIVVCDGKG